MDNRMKLVITVLVVTLPAMFLFQNCAPKTQMIESTDLALSKVGPPGDSNELPLNQEVVLDENNNQQPSNASNPSDQSNPSAPNDQASPPADDDVSYGVEDPEEEHKNDIEEALVNCQSLALNDSQNQSGEISEEPIEVNGLRGSKVLSPADFGGAKHISKISNSYGKVVLCDVKVDLIEKSGGKFILIGTEVKKITGFHGRVDMLDGSAVIDASNVKVYRSSAEGAQ